MVPEFAGHMASVGPGEMLKIADLLVLKKIGVDTAENDHHCEGHKQPPGLAGCVAPFAQSLAARSPIIEFNF